jgi:hypothetical protein
MSKTKYAVPVTQEVEEEGSWSKPGPGQKCKTLSEIEKQKWLGASSSGRAPANKHKILNSNTSTALPCKKFWTKCQRLEIKSVFICVE